MDFTLGINISVSGMFGESVGMFLEMELPQPSRAQVTVGKACAMIIACVSQARFPTESFFHGVATPPAGPRRCLPGWDPDFQLGSGG